MFVKLGDAQPIHIVDLPKELAADLLSEAEDQKNKKGVTETTEEPKDIDVS